MPRNIEYLRIVKLGDRNPACDGRVDAAHAYELGSLGVGGHERGQIVSLVSIKLALHNLCGTHGASLCDQVSR
jgi:hypothetical protein